LRDNIKIVKLTQAIIKLQRELDRAYNKKRRLEWASELQKKIIQVDLILRK
jgi:hypothetical protein